jgi:hypothetical protein
VTINGATLDDKRAEYVLHPGDDLGVADVYFKFQAGEAKDAQLVRREAWT